MQMASVFEVEPGGEQQPGWYFMSWGSGSPVGPFPTRDEAAQALMRRHNDEKNVERHPSKAETTERLIAALDRVGDLLTKIAENMERPSPGWRRMLDEFKGAVSRMPTTLRARF